MKVKTFHTFLIPRFFVWGLLGIVVVLNGEVRAGFLYVLNEHATTNQIYGYRVNEATGSLNLLNGFPMSSGGVGISSIVSTSKMTIDTFNRRLYVINDGSETISAFSINPKTGALTPLPFSPISLPSAGQWYSINVHPSGSPLVIGNCDIANPGLASYNVTAATITAAPNSPYSTGTVRPITSIFSVDGGFFYAGGGSNANALAGFSVDLSTGTLAALPNSPFATGAGAPIAPAADSQGRLFVANYQATTMSAFTTVNGIPISVTGNPFSSNVIDVGEGALHPNENFYYLANRNTARVVPFQINGNGQATTLTPVFPTAGANGALTNGLRFNKVGNFLFATNANSRNIAVFNVNGLTGLPVFVSSLPNNALGSIGLLNGVAYLPTSTAPFDFDGDERTDISIYRPAAGEWWYLRSRDSQNVAFQFGTASDKVVSADYTGDGKTDVAFWRPSNGQWFVLRSEDSSFYAFPFGTGADIPVPDDYDGDGKADAAVFREISVTWYINKSSGGTDIVGFGAAGDKPVNADYDGDGKADIAIFRPNGVGGAEWWVRRSSNASVFALQFGSSTDKAVPGDFTGDGKADVAFWRPATGFWNVLRSEDFSYYAFPFGANGDVASPGDYDGDGKLDAAVFRPSNSTWYANRSTAGTLIQQFGAAGDVPVPSAFVR